ncbi:MAG: hypothetical protein M3406_09765 [Chloroflexota bacterium]|nr:hypothetical protein [Chloroflexota bacterium]
MSRILMLTLLALAAVMAGCSLWNSTQVVQVDATEVRCAGEVSLTADECAAWGAELLAADGPNEVETLTITTKTGGGRCSADFKQASDGFATASIPCTPPGRD